MLCPVDQTQLVMSERQGVEIDYCPACRGVWLDRGELDKIIDRAVPAAPVPAPVAPTPPAPAAPAPSGRPEYGTPPGYRYKDDRYRDDDEHRSSGSDHSGSGDYRRRKKKESWLGDLFDF